MTDVEMKRSKEKWKRVIEDVNIRTVSKAGDHFFNPYRKGVYYYQIEALFLLGCNQWHKLNDIVDKMKSIMSEIPVYEDSKVSNAWEKFRNKTSRKDAIKCKDHIGRIQENMIFFQRLSTLHPYGYKLRQVHAAVDIKRVTKRNFPNGEYYYRLSTYNNIEQALPLRDYRRFTFPRHERKYVNYKFIGTIITKDKIISEGKINK